jgi:hypothetical protein
MGHVWEWFGVLYTYRSAPQPCSGSAPDAGYGAVLWGIYYGEDTKVPFRGAYSPLRGCHPGARLLPNGMGHVWELFGVLYTYRSAQQPCSGSAPDAGNGAVLWGIYYGEGAKVPFRGAYIPLGACHPGTRLLPNGMGHVWEWIGVLYTYRSAQQPCSGSAPGAGNGTQVRGIYYGEGAKVPFREAYGTLGRRAQGAGLRA